MLKEAAWMYSIKLEAKLQNANVTLFLTPSPNRGPVLQDIVLGHTWVTAELQADEG